MSERPNEYAWKVCVPLGTVGSNPTPSTILIPYETKFST